MVLWLRPPTTRPTENQRISNRLLSESKFLGVWTRAVLLDSSPNAEETS